MTRRWKLSWLGAVFLVVAAGAVVALIVAGHTPTRPVTVWEGRVTPVVSLHSSRELGVVLEDDDETLFSSPAQRAAFFRELQVLGVSVVRISSDWSVQAPDGGAAEPPAGFDGADPSDYPAAGMAPLDAAVRAAAAAGITVDIDAGFYAPRWATRSAAATVDAGADPYHLDINDTMFAAYTRMLATRYDGRFTPAGQSAALPKVSLFEIWNEPSLSWDFRPQTEAGRPISGDLYRAMVDTAVPAIRRVDPAAVVLIGNTSSGGSGSAGVDPIPFIEQLACVNARLQPIRTGSCAHFATVPAGGFADHPYQYDSPPWTVSTDSGTAQIGNLSGLQRLLDRLVAMKRLAPDAAHLWLTEQGYQSNAQLRDVSPWNEATQAQFLAVSEYLAWTDPDTLTFSQFLLRDTLVDQALAAIAAGHGAPAGTWSTGLERQDGTPKPALAMLRSPVVARVLDADGDCRAIEVWGHLQPDTASRSWVNVQFAAASGGFETVATLASGRDGVLDTVLRDTGPEPARVRLVFGDAGASITSPAAEPRRLGTQALPAGIPKRVSCG